MPARYIALVALSFSLFVVPSIAQIPIPEGTQIARDYFRDSFLLWLVEQSIVLGLGCYLLFSGRGAKLASRVEIVSGDTRVIAAAAFAGVLALLYSVAKAPIDYLQMVRLNPYFGLPTSNFPSWLLQQIVPTLQLMIVAAVVGSISLWLIRKSPKGWWSWASGAVVIFFVGSLVLGPALNYSDSEKYVPIESTEYADWDVRLDALISRVGATDVPVEVWRTTEEDFCRKQNSVVGLGPTRKIILADQIFNEWDGGQVEAAFAHELKHYLLDNTWVPVAIITVIAILGGLSVFVVANCVCRRWRATVGFDSLAKPAAIPLLVVVLQIYMLVATPAFNLTAQRIELAADRFALELTRNNEARARVSADQCGRLWLPDDTLYARLYLNTHPSVAKRIRLANEYRPWETGDPLAYGDLIDFP
jgi:STE24 endopeptidase